MIHFALNLNRTTCASVDTASSKPDKLEGENPNASMVKALFDKFDSDQNGSLDRGEVLSLVTQLGLQYKTDSSEGGEGGSELENESATQLTTDTDTNALSG